MICATGSEPDCYGTQLLPMSMTLNSSESTHYIECHFPPKSSHFLQPVISRVLAFFCLFSLFAPCYSALPSGKQKSHKIALVFGSSLGCISLLVLGIGLFLWSRHRHNQQAFFDVKGWSICYRTSAQCPYESYAHRFIIISII